MGSRFARERNRQVTPPICHKAEPPPPPPDQTDACPAGTPWQCTAIVLWHITLPLFDVDVAHQFALENFGPDQYQGEAFSLVDVGIGQIPCTTVIHFAFGDTPCSTLCEVSLTPRSASS